MWHASHTWHGSLILGGLVGALAARERSLVREQAVHGLDVLDEVDLHPILAKGLREAGMGVLREQAYPNEWRAKRSKKAGVFPEQRDRQRCDFVLTPEPGLRLGDTLIAERGVQAERSRAAGTLFEPLAAGLTAELDSALLAPEDAFWLELKLIRQFDLSAGNAGPNRTYASELVRNTRTDIAKLAGDVRIAACGLALVLFTRDEATADHDLGVLMHKCLDKDLPVSSPLTGRVTIVERIGNGACTVVLIPLRTR